MWRRMWPNPWTWTLLSHAGHVIAQDDICNQAREVCEFARLHQKLKKRNWKDYREQVLKKEEKSIPIT